MKRILLPAICIGTFLTTNIPLNAENMVIPTTFTIKFDFPTNHTVKHAITLPRDTAFHLACFSCILTGCGIIYRNLTSGNTNRSSSSNCVVAHFKDYAPSYVGVGLIALGATGFKHSSTICSP